MPAFTLGKLAKLYGLHRSTVYEAVAKGRVSTGFDRNNRRVIDLSEAIRVWGEPPASPTAKPDTRQPATMAADTYPTDIARVIAEAVAQGVAQAVEPLREEVAQLRKALHLLEHRPAATPAPAPDEPLLDVELAEILGNMKARRDKR